MDGGELKIIAGLLNLWDRKGELELVFPFKGDIKLGNCEGETMGDNGVNFIGERSIFIGGRGVLGRS